MVFYVVAIILFARIKTILNIENFNNGDDGANLYLGLGDTTIKMVETFISTIGDPQLPVYKSWL